MQQTEHTTIASASGAGPGAQGKQSWTFTALKAGTTTVVLEYSQPWQGGQKGVWKLDLSVTINQV